VRSDEADPKKPGIKRDAMIGTEATLANIAVLTEPPVQID
jgi:hypothetical protein